MHCVECNSENMRMRGSISNPRWQCADCGSARPPVHAHDKAPAVQEPEQGEDEPFEGYMGVDPGADDSTVMWAIDADTSETQSYSVDSEIVGVYCTPREIAGGFI